MQTRGPSSSRSTFVSLEINDAILEDHTVTSNSISEAFANAFQALNNRLIRMTGDLNLLQLETKHLGTIKDSHILRENINSKLIKTSNEIELTGNDLKILSKKSFSKGERRKLKELALEYSELLDKIEKLDRFVIKECKLFLKDAKTDYKQNDREPDELEDGETYPLIDKSVHKNQEHQQYDRSLQHEIDYNKQLINERENEIQSISRASNLINELFQQIGILATEQQDLVDNIEANADITRETTRKAIRQLDRTHDQHARKTSRICFYFIFGIIVSIFILTILASIF